MTSPNRAKITHLLLVSRDCTIPEGLLHLSGVETRHWDSFNDVAQVGSFSEVESAVIGKDQAIEWADACIIAMEAGNLHPVSMMFGALRRLVEGRLQLLVLVHAGHQPLDLQLPAALGDRWEAASLEELVAAGCLIQVGDLDTAIEAVRDHVSSR